MKDAGAQPIDELDLEALARGDRVAADVLVERCRGDRVYVLEQDVFAALTALSKTRSLARCWEALLAQLRSVHVDVPALKRALKAADEVEDDGDDDDNKSDTHIARLLAIAGQCEFYLDQYQIPHVSFQLDARLETARLESDVLSLFLVREYCRLYETPPSETAQHGALQKFRADARFGGVVNSVYIRVAHHDGKILIDRATPDGSAYEVSKAGAVINPKPPVRFSRPDGMLPMIEADLGATPEQALEALESITRFKEERDLVLTVSSALDILGGLGPHPVTEATGPPGAAKTTFAMVLVRLTDPNVVEMIAAPKTRRDHFINMASRRVVAYNNVSRISKDLSDAFCVSGESGWDVQRAHYTNSSASAIHARGPIVLTSVSSAVEEGDLGARTLKIELASIPASEQLSESKFWAKFDAVAPTILGGLLNALCEGLRRHESIVEEDLNLPRLASFAMWSIACETAFGWPEGNFLKCFAETAAVAAEGILSDSPVATVFLQFMEDKDGWEGLASELLKGMEALVRGPLRVAEEALQMAKNAARNKDDRAAQKKLAAAVSDYKDAQAQLGSTVNHKDWPTIPNALSRRLRSLDTQLKGAGITIRWPTSHKGGRKISMVVKRKEARDPGLGKGPSSTIDPSSPSPENMDSASSPGSRGDGASPSPGGSGDDDLRPDPRPVDPDDLPFLEDEVDYRPSSPDWRNRQNTPGLRDERKGYEI
jgi:hypothetical protein